MKTTCDICENPKYIGFIVYNTKKLYRLCFKHYKLYILNEIDIEKFIIQHNQSIIKKEYNSE